jgi:hypothetical protein
LGSARAHRPCAIHGDPRHRDRERGAAVDQDRPPLLAAEPAVGHHCIRDPLRRNSAARRPARRRVRPPPCLHGRCWSVCRQLAALRPRVVRDLADCAPCPARVRRRAACPRRPLDPDDDVPRGTRAEPRARHLGRCVRQRRRGRRAPRRSAHVLLPLELDLLHQRAGGCSRDRARAVAAAGEPDRCASPALRRRRCDLRHGRRHAARLRAHACDRGRLAHRLDGRSWAFRRSCCSPSSRSSCARGRHCYRCGSSGSGR